MATLQKLRVLEYSLNYGDYVAETCKKFRLDAKDIEGSEYFRGGKTWIIVQGQLKQENQEMATWREVEKRAEQLDLPETPTMQIATERPITTFSTTSSNVNWTSCPPAVEGYAGTPERFRKRGPADDEKGIVGDQGPIIRGH